MFYEKIEAVLSLPADKFIAIKEKFIKDVLGKIKVEIAIYNHIVADKLFKLLDKAQNTTTIKIDKSVIEFYYKEVKMLQTLKSYLEFWKDLE